MTPSSTSSIHTTALEELFKPATFGKTNLKLDWLAAATFVCGISGARMVNLIGEMYVGEILLLQIALLSMIGKRREGAVRNPVFATFVQLAVLMLAGYIISDIYRDTHAGQFLRGWARVIVQTLDFVCLATVVLRDKRYFWYFVLGISVGALIQLQIRGVSMMDVAGWKFGYSTPIAYGLGAISYFMPVKLAALAFAGLGAWNILMDFRIAGVICLIVAATLWYRAAGSNRLTVGQMLRMVMVFATAVSIAALLLITTEKEFGSRREQSNIGRAAGIMVAGWGVLESPLIGYGSWPSDPRLVSLYRSEVLEDGGAKDNKVYNTFSAHSQVLQAWIEGGILAVFFWLFYGYWLFRAGFFVALQRPLDACTGSFMFILLYDFWEFFMSPFSGPTRLPIAMGVAIICICAAEMRQHGRTKPAPALRPYAA
jgi:hypothetical protein